MTPEYHDACLVFPPLAQADFESLVRDVRCRGLQHPIVLLEGRVLDGRNRLEACRAAGVEPRFIEWQGSGSPLAWAISTNIHRRHLTASQRAILAIDLLPLLEAEAKERQRLSRGRGRSGANDGTKKPRGKACAFAASLTGCSPAYVEKAKALRDRVEELVEPVRLGYLSLPEALRLATQPVNIRRRAAEIRRVDPDRRLANVIRECLADAPTTTSSRPHRHHAGRPRIQLWCGDCLTLMPAIADGSVRIICTSPPYNVGTRYRLYDDRRPQGEYDAWLRRVFIECRRVLAPGGHLFLAAGHTPRQPQVAYNIQRIALDYFVLQNQIVWIKSIAIDGSTRGHYRPVNGNKFLNRQWEMVFHFSDGQAILDRKRVAVPHADRWSEARFARDGTGHCGGDVWFIPHPTINSREGGQRHPASFPASLAERCLQLGGVDTSTLVLDPFVGTGATLAACRSLEAPAIGIEIDPVYCETAANLCRTHILHRPRRPR
jgi:site-specific DNA-methyltransferase (adenine-specific)